MKENSVKMTFVLKRKNDRKGSFPKCAGEQPTKPSMKHNEYNVINVN